MVIVEILMFFIVAINMGGLVWYLDSCLGKKRTDYGKYILIIFPIILNYICSANNSLYFIGMISPIIGGLIYAHFYNKGKIINKLLHIVVCFAINYGITAILLYCIYAFIPLDKLSDHEIVLITNILNFISKFIFIIALYYIIKMEKYYSKFSSNIRSRALILPISSLIFLIIFVYTTTVVQVSVYLYFILVFLFLLIVNILVFINYMKLIEYQTLYFSEKFQREMKEHQEDFYELLKDIYERVRKLRHDIKNHIAFIKILLQDNKIEQAQHYTKHIDDIMDQTLIYHFENDSINYMLNLKALKQTNIDFKISISDPLDFLDDFDISIIFGNLLDNAIEAQENVDNKQIIIDIYNEFGITYIYIKNAIFESVLETNPRLLTSKTKKIEHGIGIDSVRSAVNKYNGETTIYEEENMFIVKITFFDK